MCQALQGSGTNILSSCNKHEYIYKVCLCEIYIYRCADLTFHWKGFRQGTHLYSFQVMFYFTSHHIRHVPHTWPWVPLPGNFTPSFSPKVCSLFLKCYLCHKKYKYLTGAYDATLDMGDEQAVTVPLKLT